MSLASTFMRGLTRSNLAATTFKQARNLSIQVLQFEKFGNPTDVLELKTIDVPDNIPETHVVVGMRATPINPADVNQVQGVYPVIPEDHISGTEGYGVVEKVGGKVSRVEVGDTVIPSRVGIGTWRSHMIVDEHEISKIDPTGLPLDCLAMFMANPPTAYRMLHDFVKLMPGDWVIQNAAESALGHNAIQICRMRKWKTINIIHDTGDEVKNSEVKEELEALGADFVCTDTEMYHKAVKKSMKEGKIGAPRLALNGVGGESSQFLAGSLANGGVMVTFGGMSKHAVHCPTIPLIFKNIQLAGFWMVPWYMKWKDTPEKAQMFAELANWMRNGNLLPSPNEHKDLKDWKKAFEVAESGFGKKQILVWPER